VVAAAEAAIRIGRDERERVGQRTRDSVGEQSGGDRGQPAQRPLLPGGDEETTLALVANRRPRRCERDPSAGALATTSDRPRGRRAAALAQRRADPWHHLQTRTADVGPGERAAGTPAGKNEVEQHAVNARRKRVTCL